MPIGKEQWDAFLAAVARNTVRRDRGEQSRAPSPTCEACQGTGWVTPWFDDLAGLRCAFAAVARKPNPASTTGSLGFLMIQRKSAEKR